jgi:hypothetical protein
LLAAKRSSCRWIASSLAICSGCTRFVASSAQRPSSIAIRGKISSRSCSEISVTKAAAARLQCHQPFGSEDLQRFAQRGAADAVIDRQQLLVDARSRRQFVRKNALPQPFGNFLVEGGLGYTTRQPSIFFRGLVQVPQGTLLS